MRNERGYGKGRGGKKQIEGNQQSEKKRIK
jgi:hypothetical protein